MQLETLTNKEIIARLIISTALLLMASLCGAQTLEVVASAPPVKPEEAARILLGARSDRNMTNYYVTPVDELRPRAVGTRSTPGDGPFGAFPPQDFRPLGVHYIHGITFRLPRSYHEDTAGAVRPVVRLRRSGSDVR